MLQHKEATFQTKAIFNVEPFSLLYQRGSLLATTWLCKTNTGTVIFRGCLFSLLYRITHVPSLYSWDVVQLWFANKNVNISSLLPCGASSGFFFIILNSNQTFVCTADTETGLNVILGSRFVFFSIEVFIAVFCERIRWQILGIAFLKRQPRGPKHIKSTTQTAGADHHATASLKWCCRF